jgi:hypothetical protein
MVYGTDIDWSQTTPRSPVKANRNPLSGLGDEMCGQADGWTRLFVPAISQQETFIHAYPDLRHFDLTTPRTYDAFQLPPCPELGALASQLRHLRDMTLPLASASNTWRRCRQFAYKDVSFCISVIRFAIKVNIIKLFTL